jgi:predicted O-methyltransferase YrrM
MAAALRDAYHQATQWLEKNRFPTNDLTLQLRRTRKFEHNGVSLDTGHRMADKMCDLIGGLIRSAGFKRGLEIGTLFGFSTLHLAEALQANGGNLTTVDLRVAKRRWHSGQEVENIHLAAERFIADAGYKSCVRFLAGDSTNVLPSLFLDGESFDFVLIDGSHSRYVVTLDFLNARNLITDDGIIIMDDISEGIAVKDFHHGGPNSILPALYARGEFEMLPISGNVMLLQKARR